MRDQEIHLSDVDDVNVEYLTVFLVSWRTVVHYTVNIHRNLILYNDFIQIQPLEVFWCKNSKNIWGLKYLFII